MVIPNPAQITDAPPRPKRKTPAMTDQQLIDQLLGALKLPEARVHEDDEDAHVECYTNGWNSCLHAVRQAIAAAEAREGGDNHPMQPVINCDGIHRFKENKIVSFLADRRLNELAAMNFSDEDHMQLAQLIGYSVDGYGTLSYVSDESYEQAAAQSALLAKGDV